jgi:hypothetical protein
VRGDRVPDESSAQTIVRLQDEIDGLKKQLETYQKEGPPDTNWMAQREDQFELHYRWLPPGGGNELDASVKLPWNFLFRTLAVEIVTAVSQDAQRCLAGMVNTKQHDTVAQKLVISPEDIRIIFIQLNALRLIERSPSGQRDLWRPTPYGQNQLAKMVALPRPPQGN